MTQPAPTSVQPYRGVIDAAGVVTTGRLSFALTDHLIYMHCAQLSIPVAHGFGGAWEQQICNLTEQVLARPEPPKYVLYFDGDGAWTLDDVLELHRLIEHETIDGQPIDAIYPTQADRNGDTPLAYNWHPEFFKLDFYDYSTPVTREIHGHFGLTLIRTEALRRLPKPWMCARPGLGGSWQPQAPGKMDADTTFWANFAEAGLIAARANRVILGHMELMIRWQKGPAVEGQSIGDFMQRGKPAGLRTPLVEEMPDARPVTGVTVNPAAIRGESEVGGG